MESRSMVGLWKHTVTLGNCPNPATKKGMRISAWDEKDAYVFGDRVRITCDPGYVFKDRDDYVILQCTNNGTWNRAAPECIPGRRDAVSPRLGDFSRGLCCSIQGISATISRNLLPSLCFFMGFFLKMHEVLIFFLFLSVPHCTKPVIAHGREVYTSKNDYTVGTQVRIECDEGYMLSIQESVTCQDDGNWFPTLPYCQKGRCKAGAVICAGAGQAAVLQHHIWGILVLHPTALSLEVHCPLPVVENGEMVTPQHTFPYGTTVSFYCKEGFTLQGNAEISCMADGTWHPALPECQPGGFSPSLCSWQSTDPSCYITMLCFLPSKVQCPVPTIPNGRLNPAQKELSAGSSAVLECDAGYVPMGSSTVKCLSSGRLQPRAPACTRGNEGDADMCGEVAYVQGIVSDCHVPTEDVKTLLEIQKLFLEIQKLKVELQGLSKEHVLH
uniref:Sushi domain-containing protein n=1 Tax=Coturnix japonica TaxID=93934 RepID=A0A8C2TTS2_COTJA